VSDTDLMKIPVTELLTTKTRYIYLIRDLLDNARAQHRAHGEL